MNGAETFSYLEELEGLEKTASSCKVLFLLGGVDCKLSNSNTGVALDVLGVGSGVLC